MAYKNFSNYNVVRFETEITDDGPMIKGYTFKDIFEKINDILFIIPMTFDVEGTVYKYVSIVGGVVTNNNNIFQLLNANDNPIAFANDYNGPVILITD